MDGSSDCCGEEVSDHEILPEPTAAKRAPGRPRKAAATVSACGHDEDEQPARRPRGRPAGCGGRSRVAATPPVYSGPEGEARPGKRARRTSDLYSPAEAAREHEERRRAERERERALQEAMASKAFDLYAAMDVRMICADIAAGFLSRCCQANVIPLAPETRVSTGVASNFLLAFRCDACGTVTNVRTNSTVRLALNDGDDEEEAAEPLDPEEGRRKKKRKHTNSRPEYIVREVIACLLSGRNYAEYETESITRGMPNYVSKQTFNRYLTVLLPAVCVLQKEVVDLGRKLVARYGKIDSLVLTNDFFWQTRGHNSANGSGTICDLDSGTILAFRHYCIGEDALSDAGGFEYTSKAMDAIGCGDMLDDVMRWMQYDVVPTLEEAGVSKEPSLDGIVLDGDATTNKLIPVVIEKARKLAEHRGDCATACGVNLIVYKCTNHLGKNLGKRAVEIGKKWHTTCTCRDRITEKGTINKVQPKLHRGVVNESAPVVKSYQRAASAALRGVTAWKAKPEYTDVALKDIAIQGLEEMMNHMSNIHSGPGFFTGKLRTCRLHDLAKADGTAYESSQYNDCADFNEEMQAWITKEVIERIDEVVHPCLGGVCQNASERVGMVALKYRDKETKLGPTHYTVSTGLAIAHCNNVCIHKFRVELAREGIVDQDIEAFGTMELRLHEILGVPTSEWQRDMWLRRATARAQRSIKRRTVEYKKYRKKQRKRQTEKRAGQKTHSSAKYKGDSGASSARTKGNGEAGACECAGKCLRGCPCKAARQQCTASCHPASSSTCKNCAAEPGGSARIASAACSSQEQERDPTALSAHCDVTSEPAVPQRTPPAADEPLVGRALMYNFDGAGWCLGVVDEEVDNDDEVDEETGERANYLVYYEVDDSLVAHHLHISDYSSDTSPGKPRAWHLLTK